MKFLLNKFLYFLIVFFLGFGTMLLVALPAFVITEPNIITLLGAGIIGILCILRRKHLITS